MGGERGVGERGGEWGRGGDGGVWGEWGIVGGVWGSVGGGSVGGDSLIYTGQHRQGKLSDNTNSWLIIWCIVLLQLN